VTDDSTKSLGFGFDPRRTEHHFALLLPQQREGDVAIEERFSYGRDAEIDGARLPVPKASLDWYRWGRIADTARVEFNKRLKQLEMKPGQWRGAEVLLASYFGKELTLLMWAVEDADATLIPNIVANWAGLAPEERWWLYTTVNATSGHPAHGRDRGWRKAIKIAFAENPAEVSPSSLLDDAEPIRLPLPEDLRSLPEAPDGRPRRRGSRRQGTKEAKKKGPSDQLPLLEE